MLRVLIAGVTGWTGVPLAAAVEAADDLELAGGIARRDADFPSVEAALAAAREAGRGVIAAGNYPVRAATLLHAATLAARHVDHWEVIDYGSAGKPDVPSGTARELAKRLGAA